MNDHRQKSLALARYGLSPDDLLGRGMEAEVYANLAVPLRGRKEMKENRSRRVSDD